MLLRQKKTQGEDQNWCVILNPIGSELDKKKIAQRLSGAFSLTPEEALDLVANTPIILLDHLSRSIAHKLKDYFRVAGAETLLTNDVFQKRKCYRTVWPEPPSLSFLHNWGPLKTDNHDQVLQPQEALDEIRGLARDDKKSPLPSLTSMPLLSRSERDQLQEETERWRRECLNLREEVQDLKEQLEKTRKENFLPDLGADENEAQLLLEHANEKFSGLREEYTQARHLYEEKIALLTQEAEQSKRKAHELGESLKGLQKERQAFEETLSKKQQDVQILSEETRKIKLGFEQKMAKNIEEMSLVHLQNKELTEKLHMFQKAKEELEVTINTQSEQVTYWHDRHDNMLSKLMAAEMKLEEEKNTREKNEGRYKDFEKSRMRMIHQIEEKEKLALEWEMKYSDLEKQILELKETCQNQDKILQNHFRQLEARERELEMARRQVREAHAQNEQRDAVQKRAQVAAQLVEKENLLKKLVKDQEKIETEIREREESMRAILVQQEAVEKEVVEAKQTQRHLLELTKREQKGKVRVGRELQEGSGMYPDSAEEPSQP